MVSRYLSYAAAAALFTLSTAALAQQTEPQKAAPQRPPEAPQSAHVETQPQGQTGPLDTTSGGVPAAGPQGDTPPGMQAQPEDPTGLTGRGDPTGR